MSKFKISEKIKLSPHAFRVDGKEIRLSGGSRISTGAELGVGLEGGGI